MRPVFVPSHMHGNCWINRKLTTTKCNARNTNTCKWHQLHGQLGCRVSVSENKPQHITNPVVFQTGIFFTCLLETASIHTIQGLLLLWHSRQNGGPQSDMLRVHGLQPCALHCATYLILNQWAAFYTDQGDKCTFKMVNVSSLTCKSLNHNNTVSVRVPKCTCLTYFLLPLSPSP